MSTLARIIMSTLHQSSDKIVCPVCARRRQADIKKLRDELATEEKKSKTWYEHQLTKTTFENEYNKADIDTKTAQHRVTAILHEATGGLKINYNFYCARCKKSISRSFEIEDLK